MRSLADALGRWRGVLLILVHLLTGLMIALAPNADITIAGSSISREHGLAYMAPLRHQGGLLYTLPSDSLRALTNSRLKLFENGTELGPAHAPHAQIREQGGGRFSHWGSWLRFSTSDGSDPRTNGRAYSIASPTELRISWLVALVVLDVVLLVAFRREALAWLRSDRGRKVVVGAGLGLVAFAGLAALGLFGRITLEAQGPPKDVALAVSVVAHAALGCVIALAAWAAGAGLVRAFVRDPGAALERVLIPAYPVSLLALAAFATIALALPHGRIVALALWLVCVLPLAGWRPRRSAAIGAVTVLSAIAPPALLFGAWMGVIWHGPTATLAGLPSGDHAWYAGSVWALAARPYPYVDLGFEGGHAFPYFRLLFSAIGAAFSDLPGFDALLFIAAGGAASYVLLSTAMLHLYLRDRVRDRADAFAILILVLSMLGAGLYPSWIMISVPVVHTVALTIAVWWMARRSDRMALFAMAAGLIGSVLSKVAAAGFLVPLAATQLWYRIGRSSSLVRASLLAIGGLFAVFAAVMLVQQLPLFTQLGPLGPLSLGVPRWEQLLRDAGMIVMVVLAWRIAEPPVAVVITVGLATALLFQFVFFINFICAAIVLGLLAFALRERSAGTKALMLLAFACPLPAVLLADPGGTSTGAVWAICMGSATLAAAATSVRIVGIRRRESLQAVGLLTLVVAGTGAAGLGGVASGHIIIDSGTKLMTAGLTSGLRDIWLAVRRHTPFDALIFTDQVADTPQGQTPGLLGGWNNYAFAGQRQIYISSHYTSFELRLDPAKRREVLSINDAVLRGTTAPEKVSTRRKYVGFFAVVRKSRPAPPGWEIIYENEEYALYSISTKHRSKADCDSRTALRSPGNDARAHDIGARCDRST